MRPNHRFSPITVRRIRSRTSVEAIEGGRLGAGAPVMKTGFTAMRLGMAAYIVPFIFVYWPSLILWHEADPLRLLAALVGGATAVIAMAALGEQWLTRALGWWQLALFALALVLVMHPAALANVAAVAIVLGIGAMEYRATRPPLPRKESRP